MTTIAIVGAIFLVTRCAAPLEAAATREADRRHRRRRLYLRLPAGDDGNDPPGDDERRVAECKLAPMGQFSKLRGYPDASDRDVTAPNADTLYTTIWLDVAKEPWVLSIPDMGDRYYLFPMLDAWTDVFQVPGKRTTGDKAQKYAITGPNWKGELPEGVKEPNRRPVWCGFSAASIARERRKTTKPCTRFRTNCTAVPLSAYGTGLSSRPEAGRSGYRHEDARSRAGQPLGRPQPTSRCWQS